MTTPDAARGPLAGLTVIDLTHMYNGPYATFLMAMSGAQVIKVEPLQGEYLRHGGSPEGAGLPFAMLNSNKKPVTLNLKTQQGRTLFSEMAARADIVVENFAPGVMDRLGIGASELLQMNPRLIYGSSSGYGKDGPYRDHPAMDVIMQAMCGVIASTGYVNQVPVKAGAAICDFLAGIHLYGAIMTALYERERTGIGRVVEVSMQDATYASLASSVGMLHSQGTSASTRSGNRHGGHGISPYNVYRTSDGYVVITAPADHHFHALLDLMGYGDLKTHPRLATRSSRVQYFAVVDELIEGWTRERRTDDVVTQVLAGRVPCAPVRQLAEVAQDRNMHARGSLQWIDHPDLGRIVLPGSPMVFEGTSRAIVEPSLALGACNEAVFGTWLGHSQRELLEFAAQGVIA